MVGVIGAEMAVSFRILQSGTECWNLWAVPDSPCTVFGLLKQPGLIVGLKLSMCIACKILLKMNGLECAERNC